MDDYVIPVNPLDRFREMVKSSLPESVVRSLVVTTTNRSVQTQVTMFHENLIVTQPQELVEDRPRQAAEAAARQLEILLMQRTKSGRNGGR